MLMQVLLEFHAERNILTNLQHCGRDCNRERTVFVFQLNISKEYILQIYESSSKESNNFP